MFAIPLVAGVSPITRVLDRLKYIFRRRSFGAYEGRRPDKLRRQRSAYDADKQRTGQLTALAKLLAAELSAWADGPVNAVLDAGASTGVSMRVFAERAQWTVALNISHEMLRELEAAPQESVHLLHPDGSSVPSRHLAGLTLTEPLIEFCPICSKSLGELSLRDLWNFRPQ